MPLIVTVKYDCWMSSDRLRWYWEIKKIVYSGGWPSCYEVYTRYLILTFICSYIANIFWEYNQQDATFLNLFISLRLSTCFRRFFRPSSGAQNCTYSVRHLSDRYCHLLLAARLAAGGSIGLTNAWRCMCSFELLMMDGKNAWNTSRVLKK